MAVVMYNLNENIKKMILPQTSPNDKLLWKCLMFAQPVFSNLWVENMNKEFVTHVQGALLILGQTLGEVGDMKTSIIQWATMGHKLLPVGARGAAKI